MNAVAAKIVVVDDHPGFRAALRALASLDERLDVVGEASTVPSALAMLADDAPDLVVLDVNIGEINGMDGAAMIVAAHPGVRVLLCSTAPLSQLPPMPSHADVSFVPKQDLDSETLWRWVSPPSR
jgi:chemotaxis response regulator CheB